MRCTGGRSSQPVNFSAGKKGGKKGSKKGSKKSDEKHPNFKTKCALADGGAAQLREPGAGDDMDDMEDLRFISALLRAPNVAAGGDMALAAPARGVRPQYNSGGRDPRALRAYNDLDGTVDDLQPLPYASESIVVSERCEVCPPLPMEFDPGHSRRPRHGVDAEVMQRQPQISAPSQHLNALVPAVTAAAADEKGDEPGPSDTAPQKSARFQGEEPPRAFGSPSHRPSHHLLPALHACRARFLPPHQPQPH